MPWIPRTRADVGARGAKKYAPCVPGISPRPRWRSGMARGRPKRAQLTMPRTVIFGLGEKKSDQGALKSQQIVKTSLTGLNTRAPSAADLSRAPPRDPGASPCPSRGGPARGERPLRGEPLQPGPQPQRGPQRRARQRPLRQATGSPLRRSRSCCARVNGA